MRFGGPQSAPRKANSYLSDISSHFFSHTRIGNLGTVKKRDHPKIVFQAQGSTSTCTLRSRAIFLKKHCPDNWQFHIKLISSPSFLPSSSTLFLRLMRHVFRPQNWQLQRRRWSRTFGRWIENSIRFPQFCFMTQFWANFLIERLTCKSQNEEDIK